MVDGPLVLAGRLHCRDTMPTTTVQEIMSPIVETLSVGDTLATARRQLQRGRIRHLPVVDGDEHVIGLITHRRLLEAWVSHGHPDTERPRDVAEDVPIEMLMEKDVQTVSPKTPAATAAALLESHKFGCLPVVAGGKLVGIVTEADFVRFARHYFEWEAHGELGRAAAGHAQR
jgi:CBS domain-containing membrane protein